METKHKDLLSKHKRLDNSINKTNKAANELFSMLKTRENQSTNPEFKNKLLQDINVNKKAVE